MSTGDQINDFLTKLPLGTLTFIASAIGGLIALANGSIDYTQFQLGLGATGVGTGVLGAARINARKADVPNKEAE